MVFLKKHVGPGGMGAISGPQANASFNRYTKDIEGLWKNQRKENCFK